MTKKDPICVQAQGRSTLVGRKQALLLEMKITIIILVALSLLSVIGCDSNAQPQNGNGVSSIDSLKIGDLVQSVAFSPDGQWIAMGTFYSPGDTSTVFLTRMVDGKAGTSPIALNGHTDDVNAVAFSPDSQTLATGSHDKTVRLWKVSDPTSPPRVLNILGDVVAVAYSPDGQLLAVAEDIGRIQIWSTAHLDANPQIIFGSQYVTQSIAFSPDGKLLASGSGDNSVYVWKVADLQAAPIKLIGHTSYVQSVTFSPDSQILASGDSEAQVRLWNTQHFEQNPTVLTPGNIKPNTPNPVTSLAFSRDGKRLAAGLDIDAKSYIYLWSMEHPQSILSVLQGHKGRINSLSYSPDGKILASASDDGTVRLWHLSSDK